MAPPGWGSGRVSGNPRYLNMKITKSQLRQIIKEELEDDFVDKPWHGINDKLVSAASNAVEAEIKDILQPMQPKGQADMFADPSVELNKFTSGIEYDIEEPLMDVLAPVAQQIQNKISDLGLQLESVRKDAEREEAVKYEFSSMEDYYNWVEGGRLLALRPDWRKKQDKIGQTDSGITPRDVEVPRVSLSRESLEKIIKEEIQAVLKEGANPRDAAYTSHSTRKRSALGGLAGRINNLGLELQNVNPNDPNAWQEIRRIEREIQDLQDEMINVGHGEF